MCLWNTMPPIMANSNEGQDHKDKYFERKILPQELTMCKMEALASYDQCQFFFKNWSNDNVKRLSTNKKISSQGVFMWYIKAQAFTIQKLLARLKFLKSRSNSQVKVTRSKIIELTESSDHKEYSYQLSKL